MEHCEKSQSRHTLCAFANFGTYRGKIVWTKALALRTQKAVPSGFQVTSGSLSPLHRSSMSWSFQGKGQATPPRAMLGATSAQDDDAEDVRRRVAGGTMEVQRLERWVRFRRVAAAEERRSTNWKSSGSSSSDEESSLTTPCQDFQEEEDTKEAFMICSCDGGRRDDSHNVHPQNMCQA
jgi:hypothetical protein